MDAQECAGSVLLVPAKLQTNGAHPCALVEGENNARTRLIANDCMIVPVYTITCTMCILFIIMVY